MTNDECRTTNDGRRGRRAFVCCAALAAIVCCASCARTLRNPFSTAGPPAPDVLVTAPTLDQIVVAVNSNAQRIQSYQTNNASIDIPGTMAVPTLRGNIAAMRPGRVRLQASTALTGPEVDLGSNDELYWFWVRRNQPPQVYFSRHSQSAGTAAQQLMPIDPQWLFDALGMAEFKPTDRHEGPLPIDKNRVEIKSYIQSPTGPLVKRSVIDVHKAWVLEQHIYDGRGTLLASAVAKAPFHYYIESKVSLPQTVEIRIPPAELALTIDVGTVELNRLADNPQMWTLPTIPGSPPMDLGAAPKSDPGGGVPSMGSQITGANWYDPAPGGAPMPMGAPAGPLVASGPMVATVPGVGGAAPWTPPPTVGMPAQQFVPQGTIPQGGVVQSAEPYATQATLPPGAQRLPSGGVATPAFTR